MSRERGRSLTADSVMACRSRSAACATGSGRAGRAISRALSSSMPASSSSVPACQHTAHVQFTHCAPTQHSTTQASVSPGPRRGAVRCKSSTLARRGGATQQSRWSRVHEHTRTPTYAFSHSNTRTLTRTLTHALSGIFAHACTPRGPAEDCRLPSRGTQPFALSTPHRVTLRITHTVQRHGTTATRKNR